MRILLINDPDIPVPPAQYGGIERITHMLATEYVSFKHQVTLLAGPGSEVPCPLQIFGKKGSMKTRAQRFREILEAWFYLEKNHGNFDVIHNFGRLAYLLPLFDKPVKKVMSYQREITKRNIRWAARLPHKNFFFTANSNSCASTGNVAGSWTTIYNAVLLSHYDFVPLVPRDSPLVFLGRLDRIKGVHHAIEIAKRTEHKLIIAGNKPHLAHEIDYFREEVEPYINGQEITYIGEVGEQAKNKLLGNARALLFPIEWEEPFGIVMIEALACGTPVIAFNRGSVPEVIRHGKTGYSCFSIEEMVEAIRNIDKIDRTNCRKDCEARFSSRVIADQYLSLYQS